MIKRNSRGKTGPISGRPSWMRVSSPAVNRKGDPAIADDLGNTFDRKEGRRGAPLVLDWIDDGEWKQQHLPIPWRLPPDCFVWIKNKENESRWVDRWEQGRDKGGDRGLRSFCSIITGLILDWS
ncbi:unnamed protein product [Lactuca saligna]|uniref:Uncharacterized protein n=1 Tax=Lactuca saligna TaxID=75948 RepID=A0AA36EHS9_LACSI|nr:unnamed protein product [Lactuca saligna]